jgi:hypothetical protein
MATHELVSVFLVMPGVGTHHRFFAESRAARKGIDGGARSVSDNRRRLFNQDRHFPDKSEIDHLRQVIMPQGRVSAPAASSHQLHEETREN